MKFKPEQRIEDIEKLGLRYNGEKWIGPEDSLVEDFFFHYSEVFFDSDEVFRGKLLAYSVEFSRREEALFSSISYKLQELRKAWEKFFSLVFGSIKAIFSKEKTK